ncbi:MAG TPA: hypothetical protein DEP69_04890, partial [Acidimicrobiaceae bacterium]|nr:hypothetical protein [Acidimicrobiaceae bacterium]
MQPDGAIPPTAGFPLPAWAAGTTTGDFDVVVLFVDFDRTVSDRPVSDYDVEQIRRAYEYLRANSYQKINIRFRRAPSDSSWLRSGRNTLLPHWLAREAVKLVDDDIDFSGVESVVVVVPAGALNGGSSYASSAAYTTADGQELTRAAIVAATPKRSASPTSTGYGYWTTLAHELMHNLGLADLYPYDSSLHARPPDKTSDGEVWVSIEPGLMGLEGLLSVAEDDERYLLPDGSRPAFDAHWPFEMLAWSRWQLDWLDDDQVTCVTEREADVTVELEPVAAPDADGTAMVVVPLGDSFAVVAETRRKLGEDERSVNLPVEGVYVYAVDAQKKAGELQARLATEDLFDYAAQSVVFSDASLTGRLDRDPALGVGEHRSWDLADGTRLRIDVLAATAPAVGGAAGTYTVRVRRYPSPADTVAPVVTVSGGVEGGHSFAVSVADDVGLGDGEQVELDEISFRPLGGHTAPPAAPAALIPDGAGGATVCLFGIDPSTAGLEAGLQTCSVVDPNDAAAPNAFAQLDEVAVVARAVLDAAGNPNAAAGFAIADTTAPVVTVTDVAAHRFTVVVAEAHLGRDEQVDVDEIIVYIAGP